MMLNRGACPAVPPPPFPSLLPPLPPPPPPPPLPAPCSAAVGASGMERHRYSSQLSGRRRGSVGCVCCWRRWRPLAATMAPCSSSRRCCPGTPLGLALPPRRHPTLLPVQWGAPWQSCGPRACSAASCLSAPKRATRQAGSGVLNASCWGSAGGGLPRQMAIAWLGWHQACAPRAQRCPLLPPSCQPMPGRRAPCAPPNRACMRAEGLLERALSRGDISEFDVAGGAHCMHPAYLQLSLNRSLGGAG